jgi:hypothetical protein
MRGARANPVCVMPRRVRSGGGDHRSEACEVALLLAILDHVPADIGREATSFADHAVRSLTTLGGRAAGIEQFAGKPKSGDALAVIPTQWVLFPRDRKECGREPKRMPLGAHRPRLLGVAGSLATAHGRLRLDQF